MKKQNKIPWTSPFGFGIILLTLTLGSVYSLHLITYSYFLLIAATLILGKTTLTNIQNYSQKKKQSGMLTGFTLLGTSLLTLMLGIQSPQFAFGTIGLILSIGLILYGSHKYYTQKN